MTGPQDPFAPPPQEGSDAFPARPQLGPEAFGTAQYAGYPRPGNYGTPLPGMNRLAVASLVCSLLFTPLGLVLGIVARRQIRRTGQRGNGLAAAGIVISILTFALTVALAAASMSELPQSPPGLS